MIRKKNVPLAEHAGIVYDQGESRNDMKKLLAIASAFLLALAGCQSASHDGGAQNEYSRIELSEKDVLKHSIFGRKGPGVIESSLRKPGNYSYHSGSRILVLQSGRENPDEELLAAFRKSYMPIPISGVRITLDACLRTEPEDLNYDYNDVGTGSAQNHERWPVMRDRGTSGNMGGSLHEAICSLAIDSGADTIVIVWTSSMNPKIPAFRAAIVNARTGYWEVVSPDAGTVNGPAALTPERKPAAYAALARMLEVKKDGVSIDRRPRGDADDE